MIHRDPGPPGIAAINHGPAGGAGPIAEAGLNPQGGTPAINLILQIANAPNVIQSLLTGNDVEHRVFVSMPFCKPNTDQVTKIIQICCCY